MTIKTARLRNNYPLLSSGANEPCFAPKAGNALRLCALCSRRRRLAAVG